jgi:hypothetical protein
MFPFIFLLSLAIALVPSSPANKAVGQSPAPSTQATPTTSSLSEKASFTAQFSPVITDKTDEPTSSATSMPTNAPIDYPEVTDVSPNLATETAMSTTTSIPFYSSGERASVMWILLLTIL